MSIQCLCRNLSNPSACIPVSVSVEVFHEPEALRIGTQTHRLPLLGKNRNHAPFPVILIELIRPEIKQLPLVMLFFPTFHVFNTKINT